MFFVISLIDVELLGSMVVDSLSISIGVFAESLSKASSESELTFPVNISVERKIPKNTEPKIEVVTIEIDFADIFFKLLFHQLLPAHHHQLGL